MPPRHRGSTKQSQKRATAKDEEGRSAHASVPPEEAQQREKKKKTVKWSPVFRRMGLFALMLLVPAFLNYAALSQETRVLIAKAGTMYDIGWGQKLMLRCIGEGLPTVILEAPLGQSSVVWTLVQPIIAKHTKVCVYDRAGLGLSDRAYANTSKYANDFSEAARERDKTRPSTVERMVDDLHRLVSYSSNQPKPLLLVSTDFATFISRFYTQLYEHEIAGLLLIDPAVETLFDGGQSDNSRGDNSQSQSNDQTQTHGSAWSEYWYTQALPPMQSVQVSASLGFTRIGLMLGLTSPVEEPELKRLLPEEAITTKKHLLCQPKHLSSMFDEHYFMNESMDQIKTMFHVKPFPKDLPITIATYKDTDRNQPLQLSKAWSEGHTRLHQIIHPHSRPHSRLTTLPGSNYLTFYYNPQAVAASVLSMVEAWRKEYRLAA